MQLRKVFITGVTAGLGRALAREFLAHGYQVWGIGRSPVEKARLDAFPQGDRFVYTPCDVTNAEEAARTIGVMAAAGFTPDIVILNAGVVLDDAEAGFRFPAFRQTFETNVLGAVRWIEAFLPGALARGGTFAAISSLSAYRAMNRNKVGYPSSKAALNAAFEGLRIQYGGRGVRFISFCPGPLAARGSGLLTTSYEAAAKRIFHHLHRGKRANIVRFPLVPSLLYRISRWLPDRLISRMIARLPAGETGMRA